MSVATATLRLSGATYRYAGARHDALTEVDLELTAGSVLGVVGPNEAGKSTLCLVAAGLAPVVVGGRLTGSVTIDGRETVGMRPHELAQRCGILFQDPQAQLSGTASTVFEELAFGPCNLGLPLGDVIDRVEASLATLGIAALADRDPARLSGGQAQLVALAAILALRPDFLVLDEPTSQLDPQGTRLVGEALRRLARESRTAILVVEHKTSLLDQLADRVVAGRSRSAPRGARPMIAIEVRRVGFTYPGGVRALDGVDLSVGPGETLGIIGQNGSGKSTLVRHLDGLLRPTEGQILLDGSVVGRRHVAELAALVGIAFQDPDRQIFAGRVRAEVAFGPRNLGLRGAELDRRVTEALDMVGLAGTDEENPYDLGYSRRKLLSIASVLAMRTPIVVLDEPTTGQDLRGVARVRSVVAAIAAEGRTVIAISHDMRFVAETFRRVVVMRAGKIVLDGTPAQVFAEANWPALAETYLEPPLAARVGARLGVGSTPTEASLVQALAGRA